MINAKYLRRIRKIILLARIHELQHNFRHMEGTRYYERLVALRHKLELITRKIKQDENKT